MVALSADESPSAPLQTSLPWIVVYPTNIMVTINLAYTAPINRQGDQPVLTESQVWEGLQRKVRHAEQFVPVIVACQVTKEYDNTIERDVTFAPSNTEGEAESKPNDPIHEVCVLYPPMRVDFKQEDGSTISNIVSKGPDGELLMTYAFEWRHKGVGDGNSSEEQRLKAEHERVSCSSPLRFHEDYAMIH